MNRFTNSIYKYIKPFHFKSVFFKYLKQFAIISVVPFLILSMLVYFTQAKNSEITSNNALEKLSHNVSETLNHTLVKSDQIYANLRFSTSEFFSTFDIDDIYLIHGALNSSKKLVQENEYVHSIHLYRFSENRILSTYTSGDVNYRDFRDIIKYYQKHKITNFTIKSTAYNIATKKDSDMLSFCYGVYSNSNCLGLIIINYDFNKLDKLLNANEGEEFYITDKDGYVMYSNNRKLVGTKLSASYSYESQKLINKSDYTAIATPIRTGSLNFVSVYRDNYNSNATLYLKVTFILSVIVAILLALLLSLYVSYSFYKSITEIINGFSIIKTDEISENITDEINYITQKTSELIDKNQSFERELSENMAQIKSLQLTASQLQFNHHFLFNTLNLISVLAHDLVKGENGVSKSIELLSDLLRISLDTNQYTNSIGAEILYAKKYIELEQLKYENIFDVEWDIDPKINNYRIIKLILQPIIENAFSHALKPLPKGIEKKLRISAHENGNTIVFHITDNGVGFGKEKLDEINKSLSRDSFTRTKHIGLTNINSRIKLLFGEECGIKIHPLNQGTDIEIVIQKMDFNP